MDDDERDASCCGVTEAEDEAVAAEPAAQGVAQASLPFPVDETHGSLAAQEGGLDQPFDGRQGLVRAQAVQVGFRHAASGFGQEQQALERVAAWVGVGHGFPL